MGAIDAYISRGKDTDVTRLFTREPDGGPDIEVMTTVLDLSFDESISEKLWTNSSTFKSVTNPHIIEEYYNMDDEYRTVWPLA